MRAILLGLVLAVLAPSAEGADLDKPLILVAKPELRDQLFGASVLVVAPIGGGQHVGFIVNRPTGTTLGSVFPDHAASQKVVDPVHVGGPVQPGVLFALVHRRTTPGGNSFEMMPGLYAAIEEEVIDRIIESEPQRARFVAGLVSWRDGELRREIELGAWDVVDADPSLVTRSSSSVPSAAETRSRARPICRRH
jgi:putative transcriptional regulator